MRSCFPIVPDAPQERADDDPIGPQSPYDSDRMGAVACSFGLWGAAYLFGQVALAEVSPFTVVFSRVALATVALIAVGLFAGQTFKFSWKLAVVYLALGALGVLIPSILMLWSQTRIGVGLTSLLGATAPLFTAVIAPFLTIDEKMTPSRLGGMALA